MNKSMQAALCYMFQDECDYRYINSRFKCWNKINKKYKSRHREEFRDLCLQYWGIEEKNTLKYCKCQKFMDKFSDEVKDKEVWRLMNNFRRFP